MVKAYLSYAPVRRCGEIVSPTAPILALPSAGRAALVAAPAVDAVNVWNLRSQTLVVSLFNRDTRRAGPVTALALAPDAATLAVGYSDGSIRIWDLSAAIRRAADSRAISAEADGAEEKEPESQVTFNGHRSAISSLCFMLSPQGDELNQSGEQPARKHGQKRKSAEAAADESINASLAPTRLASGSNDGDILLWDISGESGLFRLMAHNDAVTSLKLIARSPSAVIVSASKDGLLRVHDVESQHCIQTVVGHHAEVWAMDIDPAHRLLVTGSVDAELRAFSIKASQESGEAIGDGSSTDDGLDASAVLVDLGAVKRSASAGRVVDMSIRPIKGHPYLCVCAADNSAELFRLRSPTEAEQHRRRRKQRRAEKAKKAAAAAEAEGRPQEEQPKVVDAISKEDGSEESVVAKDFFISLRTFKTPSKARSVVFADSLKASTVAPSSAGGSSSKTTDIRVVMQLNNNSMELHSILVASKKSKKRKKQKHRGGDGAGAGASEENAQDVGAEEVDDDNVGAMTRVTGLHVPGHRGDVRAVAISPDDATILSVSRKSAKLWNLATGKCIRTMTTAGYSLAASFIGSDARFAAVCSKEGALELFDLGSGELVSSVADAHAGAIWGMALDDRVYDSTTLVTGGADKCVKFWDFSDVISPGGAGSMKLLRTLELPDEVLAVTVAYGREKPVLVVALMDATVRAFDMSSLDPYMNFYGHKMPVLSVSVSSDGLLLATGSADKTIKIWGMDFGDCRRSMRAHEDSVQSVTFQVGTHYLFSGSRDGTLKYWDCDRHEFIAAMEGQRGHVWSVAVGEDGELIATGGRDRLLRVWRRTDEQIFLEEEQDRRMDEMFESTLIDEDNKEAHKARSKVVGFMEDPTKGEALPAGKKSLETVKAGEKLMEAIELGEAERRREQEDADEAPSPLLLGLSADDYVLRTLNQIRSSEVDQALTLLPLDQAIVLMAYCSRLLQESCIKSRLSTELLSRVALHLIKLHHNQIISGAADRKLVAELRDALDARLSDLRGRFGFNASALSFWQAELADRDETTFQDASARAFNTVKKSRERRKRARF